MPVIYTLADNAGGKFTLDGDQVKVAGALPGGDETIIITATDDNGWTKTFNFVIPVAYVLKVLALSNSSFPAGAAAGFVIGSILNRTPGSTLSIVTPSDGRLAIDGSGNLIAGLTPSTIGTINATIRETFVGAVGSPKDKNLTLTVVNAAPVNTVAPAISGTLVVGQTLSVTDGTWTGSPTLSRQWKADGVDVPGATSSTYLVGLSDVGKVVSCVVTATNIYGSASAAAPGVGLLDSLFVRNARLGMSHWIAARNAAKAGSATAIINLVGDSRAAGLGVGGDVNGYTDARLLGPSGILAARLNAKGIPARNTALIGTGTRGSTDLAGAKLFNSNLIDWTGNWAAGDTIDGFGGYYFRASAAGSITFTSPVACTEIAIWYPTNTPLGSFSYSVDGGAATTINGGVSVGFRKVTITGLTLGIHTVTFAWVSGGCYVGGPIFRVATKAIEVLNGGGGGFTSTMYNSALGYGPARASEALNPALTIIALGTNDASTSTLQANLTALVTRARNTGDAILICPGPTSGGAWGTIQSDVRTMMLALSDTLGCPLIDFVALNGSWAAMNAAGKEFDNLHENVSGYTPEWQLVADVLAAL